MSLTDTPQRDGADRALEGVSSAFASAEAVVGGSSLDRYFIAGVQVDVRFASADMRTGFSPAFAHLRVPRDAEATGPCLTVGAWDSASTGAPPPPRPPVGDGHEPGALFHTYEPPVRAAYQPGLEALSVYDEEGARAWYWVADADAQPDWNRASPLRHILFWRLGSQGCLQVHGAGVGTADGGVLVVGKGGSGKSTVALSCLGSNLLYAGDDYVGVTLGQPPRIHSLYSSAKLEADELQLRLPRLWPLVANPDRLDREKAIVYVHEHFPSQTTSGFPLRAVLVPRIRAEQREARIVKTTKIGAFTALAPSTIFQLHTAERDVLTSLSRLIESVPCFSLELGLDVATIPSAIEGLLSELTTDAR